MSEEVAREDMIPATENFPGIEEHPGWPQVFAHLQKYPDDQQPLIDFALKEGFEYVPNVKAPEDETNIGTQSGGNPTDTGLYGSDDEKDFWSTPLYNAPVNTEGLIGSTNLNTADIVDPQMLMEYLRQQYENPALDETERAAKINSLVANLKMGGYLDEDYYSAYSQNLDDDIIRAAAAAQSASHDSGNQIWFDSPNGQLDQIAQRRSEGTFGDGEKLIQYGPAKAMVKEWMGRNNIQITKFALDQAAGLIANAPDGQAAFEGIQNNYINVHLKGEYPAWSQDMKAGGMDMYSLSDPYRSLVADTFGLFEDEVDMRDPLVTAAMTATDEQGNPMKLTRPAFEQMMKDDERWGYTDAAHQELDQKLGDLFPISGSMA